MFVLFLVLFSAAASPMKPFFHLVALVKTDSWDFWKSLLCKMCNTLFLLWEFASSKFKTDLLLNSNKVEFMKNWVWTPWLCLWLVAQGQLDMEGALTARDRVGIQDFVLLDETTEAAFLGNLKKRFSKDLIYVSLGKDFFNPAEDKRMLIILSHCFRLTSAHYWCRSIPTKSWTSTIRNKWNSTWVLTFLSFRHTCECIICMNILSTYFLHVSMGFSTPDLETEFWIVAKCSNCLCCVMITPHPCSYALADSAYQTMMMEFNNHFILISGESGAGKTEASKKILQYYAVSCPSTALLNTVRDKMLMSNPVLEVRCLFSVIVAT